MDNLLPIFLGLDWIDRIDLFIDRTIINWLQEIKLSDAIVHSSSRKIYIPHLRSISSVFKVTLDDMPRNIVVAHLNAGIEGSLYPFSR